MRLTYAERKKMPKSEFAVPSKREDGKGGYPIPDAAHGRNALARVAQHGTEAEKKAVRAKVHRKFPNIGRNDSAMGKEYESPTEAASEMEVAPVKVSAHQRRPPMRRNPGGPPAQGTGIMRHAENHPLSKSVPCKFVPGMGYAVKEQRA